MTDKTSAEWRRSTYSSSDGKCVEVRDGVPGVVPVRDSKVPGGPQLAVGAGAWGAFVTSLKSDLG
ncbi:DUF397 domain-containing protein [Streptomyces hoynatensis]|uniref:DUF397 domain-containing protein n=1 Tax=Streptomyces hoynatensis TaxID=1141874 RepID=A0A3A9YKR3_9ACTN|nr:DUF397 domain-containing protein [Streptomyces hoynatensis]RKN35864.1 DUF397 domain-containing protein [Streptomyces hoynatensis]